MPTETEQEKISQRNNGNLQNLNGNENMARFVNDIVSMLTEEARRALDSTAEEKLEWAAMLLEDARKYELFYPFACKIENKDLWNTLKKVRYGNAVENSDWQSAKYFM